jgi:hypothetical protein
MAEIDDTLMREIIGREVGDAMKKVLDRIDDPVLAAKIAGQGAEVACAYTISLMEQHLKMPRTESDCTDIVLMVMHALTDQMLCLVPAMMKKYGIVRDA